MELEQTRECLQIKYKVRGESTKNPGEGIVSIAEEENAEMIVMGTRGLGKVGFILLSRWKKKIAVTKRPTITFIDPLFVLTSLPSVTSSLYKSDGIHGMSLHHHVSVFVPHQCTEISYVRSSKEKRPTSPQQLRVEASRPRPHPHRLLMNIQVSEEPEMHNIIPYLSLQIKRALLGSVSDYVVRNALLPVVIVPARGKKARKASQSK